MLKPSEILIAMNAKNHFIPQLYSRYKNFTMDDYFSSLKLRSDIPKCTNAKI
jgi:hypothetical protein